MRLRELVEDVKNFDVDVDASSLYDISPHRLPANIMFDDGFGPVAATVLRLNLKGRIEFVRCHVDR